jgi:two-component system, OmpR family, response regulator MtrA
LGGIFLVWGSTVTVRKSGVNGMNGEAMVQQLPVATAAPMPGVFPRQTVDMDRRILLIAREGARFSKVVDSLAREGYLIVYGHDARDADRLFSGAVDAVIIDLADFDRGLALCRDLHARSSVPIVLLGSSSLSEELVGAFDAGANDYLRAPLDPTELRARVRTLMQRIRESTRARMTIQVEDLEIDLAAFTAWKDGRRLVLSATEFLLLCELARNKGQPVTREDLVQTVWGFEHLGGSRLVDMAIYRLRQKIEDDPSMPRLLVTVRGRGYRLG